MRTEIIAVIGAGGGPHRCTCDPLRGALAQRIVQPKTATPRREPRTEEKSTRRTTLKPQRRSMRWLWAIGSVRGLYDDVCHVLGEEGERETKDRA